MIWWQWLMVAMGAVLAIYAGFVGALVLAGRREEARAVGGFIPDCIVLFRRLLADARVPRRRKLLIVALLGYLALPIDLIPDFVPVAGQLDDVLFAALVLRAVLRAGGPELLREHWPGPPASLDVLVRLAYGDAAPERLPAQAPAPASLRSSGGERERLIRRAKALSWLSLAYMTAEGAIAIAAAVLAGSVALLGFGLDSAVEGLASVIVIWRFTGGRRLSEDAERRAERLVAVTFFALAPYIAQDAIRTLAAGEHPETSWLGIGLSISSIIVMPLLGRAKQRIGRRLGSGATAGEGAQNLLCAYLAAGVLAGLALNAAFGLWWLDPVVALGIAVLALHEGREAWRGEGCCVASPASAQPPRTVVDDCCTGSRLRATTAAPAIVEASAVPSSSSLRAAGATADRTGRQARPGPRWTRALATRSRRR